MSSALTIVSWCPGGTCDPCKTTCKWGVLESDGTVTGPEEGFILADDGSIDIIKNFCINPLGGSFFLGMGLVAASGGEAGDIVDGYLDLNLSGRWVGPAPPTSVPAMPDPVQLLKVQFSGDFWTTYDPGTGVISGFSATTDLSTHDASGSVVQSGTWSAISRLTISDCILLDVTFPDADRPPWNCVSPMLFIALPTINITDFALYVPFFLESGIDSLGGEAVTPVGFQYDSDGMGGWVEDSTSPLDTYQNAVAYAPWFIYRV